MEVGTEGLVILFSIIIGSYYIINMYNEKDLVKITSDVDNEKYTVQIKHDSKEAADLIAKIKQRIITLIEHMEKTFGISDERVANLKNNFRPDRLKEGVDTPGYTSYSVNKGEQIVLCLRNKDDLVDINTMMFVAIHELGHLMTKEIGHVPPFWDNMKFLLEKGIELGIYKKQDFHSNPVDYCGTKITDSPLK